VIAALLIPVCVAAALTFGDLILAQGTGPEVKGIHAGLAFLVGVAVYVVIFLFFHRSIFRTLFDRGPVQSMWSTITGYRLPHPTGDGAPPEVPVDERGRRVPLWAAILPYLLPIYTALAVLAVWLINYTGVFGRWYPIVQAFAIGLTLAFHLFLVGNDIRTRQRALRTAGTFFTLVLLFLFNVEILALLAWVIFKNANFVDFNTELLALTEKEYLWFWDLVTGWLR
jgi:hypothetical protein